MLIKPEKFLIAEGLGDTPRQYLVHTEQPRFIAEIDEVIFPDGREYTFKPCMLIDPVSDDDSTLMARISREAGEFLQQYDRHTDRFLAEHGDSSWRL